MNQDQDAVQDFPAGLLARWKPLRSLGRGAMGSVVLVEDRELGRRAAVKLMHAFSERQYKERFQREAKALSLVRHPQVVEIFDHGVLPEGPYLIMEALEGKPLDTEDLKFDPLRVMLLLAKGIEAIHEHGLVHRDLKPANLFLCDDGRPVLLDFGLILDPKRTKLTREGAFVGTFGLASPEVLQGRPATAASDWYSWGATLYRFLEGRLPYSLPDLIDVTEGKGLPPPSFRTLDPESPKAWLLRACLAEDPSQRPQTLAELEEIFAKSQAPPEPRPLSSDQRKLVAPVRVPDSQAGLRSHPLPALSATDSFVAQLSPKTQSALVLAPILTLAVAVWWLFFRPPAAAPTLAPEVSLAQRLEEDFAELRERVRGPVSEDPLELPKLLDRLPSLGPLLSELDHGDWSSLEEPQGQLTMAEVDQIFRDRGLYPYFEAFRDLSPAPSKVSLPEFLRGLELEGFGARSASGWLGAAYQALDQAARTQVELEKQLYAPFDHPPPKGFADPIWNARTLSLKASPTVHQWVRSLSAEPGFRPGVQAWLQEGQIQTHRFLLATRQSLRHEPETVDEAAVLIALIADKISAFFYSPAFYLDPQRTLAGPAQTPHENFLLSHVLRLHRAVGRRLGRDPEESTRTRLFSAWAEVRTLEFQVNPTRDRILEDAYQSEITEALRPMDQRRLSDCLRALFRRPYRFQDWRRKWLLETLAEATDGASLGAVLGRRDVSGGIRAWLEDTPELSPQHRQTLEGMLREG